MKIKSELSKSLIILLAFTLFIGIIYYVRHRIGTFAKLTTGVTTGHSDGGTSAPGRLIIDYDYSVNSIKHSFTYQIPYEQINEHNFINHVMTKSFPVIYDSTSDWNSTLLITPRDFKSYNIPFPDSLKWVLKYLK